MIDTPKIALILLAAGTSSRFGAEDKLLSQLKGRTILEYSANLFCGTSEFYRLAVIGDGDKKRECLLRLCKWNILKNPTPDIGQGLSISLAIQHIQQMAHIEAALIILGDMPNINEQYLKALIMKASSNTEAVMSRTGDILSPPAIFKRSTFSALTQLAGDTGAKNLFKSLSSKSTLALPEQMGIDIDTKADLQQLDRLTGDAKPLATGHE